MGVTDEETNLVEVTVTLHAMYHFCNYQLWCNIEDYVAWRGLSGQISEAEFIKEKQSVFGRIGNDILREKIKNDPQFEQEMILRRLITWNKNREKHLLKIKETQPKGVELARTPEDIEKKKKTFREIEHQKGEKNSQYGKMWIHNLELKESKRIYKNEPIPEGWNKGRIVNFDAYEKKMQLKETKKMEQKVELQNKIKYYSMLYDLYVSKGFNYIKNKFNYNKTQENLIMLFKKYVPHYIPYECVLKPLSLNNIK